MGEHVSPCKTASRVMLSRPARHEVASIIRRKGGMSVAGKGFFVIGFPFVFAFGRDLRFEDEEEDADDGEAEEDAFEAVEAVDDEERASEALDSGRGDTAAVNGNGGAIVQGVFRRRWCRTVRQMSISKCKSK